jgi:effector-binding domain-containing protein
MKLSQIYGVQLAALFKKGDIKMMGAPMAWYKSQKAPYFFEAGVPINKVPTKLPKGVYIKQTPTDSALVAHFYGPYNLLPQGYTALKEWLTDNKKKAKDAPYEVYVGDVIDKEGKPKDPYKIQTDIVFPHF